MLQETSRRITDALGRSLVENANAFGRECFRNAPAALVAVAYAAAVGSMSDIRLSQIATSAAYMLKDLCVYTFVTVGAFRLAPRLGATRHRNPLRHVAPAVEAAVARGTLGRWLARLWPFALLAGTFSTFKPTIIDHAGGFLWDEWLAQAGRVIHFGYMPWQLLQPWLGHPWITRILDLNYVLWFGVMWVFLIGMTAFSRDETHRQRSMLSFMLLWIVAGSCLAAGFASAGPCFYGAVVAGENPYAELMAYLQRTHDSIGLLSVDAQAMLWSDHVSGHGVLGISAMPSMHNAVAALMVVACRRFNIWLRLSLSVHAVLVFLGSILLGWHYGVDAYTAWMSVAVVWAAADPLAKWWAGHLEGRRSGNLVPQPA